MKRRTKIGLTLLALAAALFLTGKFVVRLTIIVGESMAPTLQPWDLCLMKVVRNYQPRQGDVVMFRTADDPPLWFIKRVVAIPGETVGSTLVPAGKVYVTGDNRSVEPEAMLQGLIATRLVTGRMIWHWRWKR